MFQKDERQSAGKEVVGRGPRFVYPVVKLGINKVPPPRAV
jgi:hypothetical protein